MAEGVNGLVTVYMLLVGAVPSYIALGAFVWPRGRIQNQVTKAPIAPRTTTPTTAPPTIAVVLDFGGETEEAAVGGDIPVVGPNVIVAGSVVNETSVAVDSSLVVVAATAVTVDCSLVAVDSGASKNRWQLDDVRYITMNSPPAS